MNAPAQADLIKPLLDTDGLAAHRAVYELKLREARESADLVALNGRMVIEWSGNACIGFAVSQRIFSELTDTSGNVMTSDTRSSSWESPNGDEFQFELDQYINNILVEEMKGRAEIGGGWSRNAPLPEGAAHFIKPVEQDVMLPSGTLFPSEHLVRIIEAAAAGETSLVAPVFDGSDDEIVYATASYIGAEASGEGADYGERSYGEALDAVRAWPVTISYFDPDNAEGFPLYEVSFRLFENGVSGDLVMSYDDFTVTGSLTELELINERACDNGPAP